jgi:hypothetical protein
MDDGSFDWYALIDKMESEKIMKELGNLSKEELQIFCINLIRCWAYQQKQNEIHDEHFYREIIRLLNE